MVGGLLANLDLAQLHAGVVRRLGHDLLEHVFAHEVRARAGGQIPAARQELHGAGVDLLVAAGRLADLRAALGECRRVEHDEVEGAARLAHALARLKARQEVEHICAGEARVCV